MPALHTQATPAPAALNPLERRDWLIAAALMLGFASTRVAWLLLEPKTAVYWEEAYRYVAAVELASGGGHAFLDYQADHYQGGSLFMITLASLLFRVVTPSLVALKLTATTFSMLICGLSYLVPARLFDRRTALLCGLAYIAGPSLVAYWGTVPMGSHGESIGFSLVQALLLGGLLSGEWDDTRGWAGFGLCAGLGFWFCYTSGMTTLACGAVWLALRGWPGARHFGAAVAGFAVGMLPWFAYNVTRDWVGFGRIFEIFGGGDPIDHWIEIGAPSKFWLLVSQDLPTGWLLPLGSDLLPTAARLLEAAYMLPLALGFGFAALRSAQLLLARIRGGRPAQGLQGVQDAGALREHAAREYELVFVGYALVFLAVFLGSNFVIDPIQPPVKYRLFLPIGVLLVPPAARTASLWMQRRGRGRIAATGLATLALIASGSCLAATAARYEGGVVMDPARFGPITRGLLIHRKYEAKPEAALVLLRAPERELDRIQAFSGFGWGLEFRFESDGDFSHIAEWVDRVDGDERLGMLSGLRYWSGKRLVQLKVLIKQGKARPLERAIVANLEQLPKQLNERYPLPGLSEGAPAKGALRAARRRAQMRARELERGIPEGIAR